MFWLFALHLRWLAQVESKLSEFCAGGLVVSMQQAANPKTISDLNKHRGVFDIDDLLGGCHGDVQGQPENRRVRFMEPDQAGGNKCIHKSVELELMNPIVIEFPRLVAEHDDLQPILNLCLLYTSSAMG